MPDDDMFERDENGSPVILGFEDIDEPGWPLKQTRAQASALTQMVITSFSARLKASSNPALQKLASSRIEPSAEGLLPKDEADAP